MGRGGSQQRFNLRAREDGRRFEADEASLVPGPEQQFMRIWKFRAMDEAQSNTIRAGGNRNDGIGWPFGG